MSKSKNKHQLSVLHGHEFSPMERATQTKNKREKHRQGDAFDRKGKHKNREED